MTTSQRKDALQPGVTLHSYRVIDVLGAGAFGITYLAEHNLLNTRHVIKEYLPDSALRTHSGNTVSPKSTADTELFKWGLDNFFQEARFVHELNHPNIVKVSDLFEANGTAYFVMPFLDGVTLHQWMKKHPQPSQHELLDIFVPLLEGLKHIHQKNLLHRDIKPENIYITENGNPVLIDFGAARLAIGEKSKALTQVLTPHFAPWEQYRSKGDFSPALDYYSLAACMYQAITGQLPEEAPNRLEDDPLQPLAGQAQYQALYSHSFLNAVDKGLAVYAKDRFQDAFEFQLALMEQEAPTASTAQKQTKATLTARLDEEEPDAPIGIVPDAPLTIRAGASTLTPSEKKGGKVDSETQQSKKKSAKAGIWVVLFVLLAGSGAGAFYLYPDLFTADDTEEVTEVVTDTPTETRSRRGREQVEDIDVLPSQEMVEAVIDAEERSAASIEDEGEIEHTEDVEVAVDPDAEQRQQEQTQWEKALAENSLEKVSAYLTECSLCEQRQAAEQLQQQLQREAREREAERAAIAADRALWDSSISGNTETAYQNYLENCQRCEQRTQARERLQQLVQAREAQEQDDRAWAVASRTDTEASYARYLETCTLCARRAIAQNRYQDRRAARVAEEAALAQEQRESAAWERAQEEDSERAYDDYLTSCLNCDYRDDALAALDLLRRLDQEVTVGIEDADFTSIREALARVRPGATIKVRPGIYNESVVIDKPITLVGDGERTQIVIRGQARYALHLRSDQVNVENLTIRQAAGVGSIFAILIDQGSPLLENLDASSDSGAVIAIRDGASPTIRNSEIHSGNEAGIFIHEGGEGRIERNRIHGNGLANIEIRDTSTAPIVSDNEIFAANQSGIFIHAGATPQIANNDIYRNSLAGISVRDEANPEVTGNRIREGKEEGIVVYQQGRGTFTDNEIFQNQRAGFAVYEQGNPRVRNNRIYNGKASGIFVYDGGTGRFEQNEVYQQHLSNVVVTNGGNPRFLDNDIYESEQVGVFIYTEGRGYFENNRIRGNVIAGVEVRTQSQPVFVQNEISNSEVGVYVHESGAGEFSNNQIINNSAVGFAVASEGEPTVTNNQIQNNGDGVAAYPQARGTFRGNEVRQNRGRNWAVAQGSNILRR